MSKINFIQNKEIIPDTHFFVYKNKKYPFKFDYFKYASNFFSANKEKIIKTKEIDLLDSETEIISKISISENVITDFINFAQGQKILLNNENVIALNYLSNKYEIETLQNKTSQYIGDNLHEIVLDILNLDQNEPNFDTKPYEEIVSSYLYKYIKDDRLLTLKIPVLYRIFTQYLADGKNKENQKDEIIEFLFKILDQKGQEASVLFNLIPFGTRNQECVTRLITKYSSIFNFQFITSQIIEALVNTQKDFLQLKEKYDENNQLNDQLKKQIEKMQNDNQTLHKKINQIKLTYSKEMEIQKQNSIKQNDEIIKLKNEIRKRLTEKELEDKFQNLIPVNKSWINEKDLKKFTLNDKMTYKVISSTFFDSLHLARNLFDGKNEINDDRNVWACSEDDKNPSIQINFSLPVVANALIIIARRSPWNTQAPIYLEIFGINDNSNEILLGKFNKLNWSPNEKHVFPFVNDKPFSNYKIKFLKPKQESVSLACLNLGVDDLYFH